MWKSSRLPQHSEVVSLHDATRWPLPTGTSAAVKSKSVKRLNPHPASWFLTDFATGRVPPEEKLALWTISDSFKSVKQMQSSEEGRRRQYMHFRLKWHLRWTLMLSYKVLLWSSPGSLLRSWKQLQNIDKWIMRLLISFSTLGRAIRISWVHLDFTKPE